MINNSIVSVDISEEYNFSKETLESISRNRWVKNQWPLVYFIKSRERNEAYVGESTNFSSRIKNHLSNSKKSVLNKITIIGSEKFNKSATLDIESKLIQYISAEGSYQLLNGNYGLINHNYYQQELYQDLFVEIWDQLKDKKVVTKTLSEIENSELFKYSPFKSLNEDQYNSVFEIIHNILYQKKKQVFVKGAAGTGKTILATYLIKLLVSKIDESKLENLNEKDIQEINVIRDFQERYPNPKIGLVIAMSSLRKTLKNVFRNTPGLKPNMVISPSETFKEHYDLLIVDEAHRLRQYRNIGWMGVFKKNNRKLGLDDSGTELDWIINNSENQIFFYDSAQSVKPSDIDSSNYNYWINSKSSITLELNSQMRVKGGNDYISFVDRLLNQRLKEDEKFQHSNYELLLYENLADLYEDLEEKENNLGLCRLISGYSFPWKSDPKSKNPDLNAIDIEIDGLEFQWNKTDKDWINSLTAFSEVGCIHTTQGYDLNYSGIIFGKEIIFNKVTQKIEVDSTNYFDKNGKRGISDINDLHSYIINIYKTIMYRGIRGTFIYACNTDLREYFSRYISLIESRKKNLNGLKIENNQFQNSIPYYNLQAAAGDFSELQEIDDNKWIELPEYVRFSEDYFACKVVGESMNKIIPNDSICLFKKYRGGSRNGRIVLAQSTEIQDNDFGSGYTVKEYQSTKTSNDDTWSHSSITLKPQSSDKSFKPIILSEEELEDFKVIGMFEMVLV